MDILILTIILILPIVALYGAYQRKLLKTFIVPIFSGLLLQLMAVQLPGLVGSLSDACSECISQNDHLFYWFVTPTGFVMGVVLVVTTMIQIGKIKIVKK